MWHAFAMKQQGGQKDLPSINLEIRRCLLLLPILGAECPKDDSRDALHYFQTLRQQIQIAAIKLNILDRLCFQSQSIAKDETNSFCFPQQDIPRTQAAAL